MTTQTTIGNLNSSRGALRNAAAQGRREAVKYFADKDKATNKAALARTGEDAKQARVGRKKALEQARQTCKVNVAATRASTKDKPTGRRRAELAKTRTGCAVAVQEIEERSAQELEAISTQREALKAERRGAAGSRKFNRAIQKTREARTTPRERREDALDAVRHGLEPELLPYFEQIKTSGEFKRRLASGRVSALEAVLEMAQEDPEAVLAAYEHAAEVELQHMIHQYETEGGRLAEPSQVEDTPQNR
ncbi:MAG: hypothetical protein IPK82_23940 [Polyangiaceae bacterium]|nr:hypothetical protein [Polyangiaceae bacterium]